MLTLRSRAVRLVYINRVRSESQQLFSTFFAFFANFLVFRTLLSKESPRVPLLGSTFCTVPKENVRVLSAPERLHVDHNHADRKRDSPHAQSLLRCTQQIIHHLNKLLCLHCAADVALDAPIHLFTAAVHIHRIRGVDEGRRRDHILIMRNG